MQGLEESLKVLRREAISPEARRRDFLRAWRAFLRSPAGPNTRGERSERRATEGEKNKKAMAMIHGVLWLSQGQNMAGKLRYDAGGRKQK